MVLKCKKELTELSTGTQFIITGTHGTIITKKENAEIINKEIILMSKKSKNKRSYK
jgi:hypothetical protein